MYVHSVFVFFSKMKSKKYLRVPCAASEYKSPSLSLYSSHTQSVSQVQQNARNALIHPRCCPLLPSGSSSPPPLTVQHFHPQEHVKHTPDTYRKEVDATPPSDQESDNVQKPHELPSGYSRAGVKTGEYSSVGYGGKAPFGAKEKGAKSAKGSGGAA